ncbi:unnamed protein product, partial [Musa acuminata subsp. burmannicoides]
RRGPNYDRKKAQAINSSKSYSVMNKSLCQSRVFSLCSSVFYLHGFAITWRTELF